MQDVGVVRGFKREHDQLFDEQDREAVIGELPKCAQDRRDNLWGEAERRLTSISSFGCIISALLYLDKLPLFRPDRYQTVVS
ncbi:MAG: hypothetical protein WAV72_03365 [Bradyrhizobium sp.]